MSEETAKVFLYNLNESLQPDRARRTQAEKYFQSCETAPGFSLMVLSFLQNEGLQPPLKQAAAILFKNFVKRCWGDDAAINSNDRQQIKTNIVALLLTVSPQVQKQLSEALTIIAQHDFPDSWKELLPELVSKLQSPDVNVTIGILRICHSIFKRYRHQFKTDSVILELKYILELIQQPLLGLFVNVNKLAHDPGAHPESLKFVFTAILLMCKIFHSLCSVDLPEFFEDHLKEYMTEFHKLLVYETKNPHLQSDKEDEPGLLLKVQASICHNINLFIGKYEEEFTTFYQSFVADVWGLLNKSGKEQKYDQLVSTAIAFLTSASKSVHHKLFDDPNTLNQICLNIVIPNMTFRDTDEETFQMNPVEYIRQDMEGSDSDTRRRSACELIKGLRKNYEQKVTEICSVFLQSMLQEYAANPQANWKAKDAAIHLVIALSVKGITAAQGSTSTNELFPILPFFNQHVLPELSQTYSPVLQSDALKFITTFRSQIGPLQNLLPFFVKLLGSEEYVVHTYAANAIERYLTIKDTVNGVQKLRYGKEAILPNLEALFVALFKVLENQESKENEYIMKVIMRVIVTVQQDIIPIHGQVVDKLLVILANVYKNPTNPVFNHYLFESLAAVIKNVSVTNMDPVVFSNLENKLFQAFRVILSAEITEFEPYIFQILSQILELNPSTTISPTYVQIFPDLLLPPLWLRKGNVPALVRLLSAYLRKCAPSIVAGNYLPGVLGVFQKLISSSTTDHDGFLLLEAIVEHISMGDLEKYVPEILGIIFRRLTSHKTTKFIRSFLIFLSVFIGKHNAIFVVPKIDSLQPHLFKMVLESLLIPHIQKVTGKIERKMCAIAVTKLVAECPPMLADPYVAAWPQLLKILISLLADAPEEETENDVTDKLIVNGEEPDGYNPSFSHLAHSTKLNLDPFAGVADPRAYFAASLNNLCKNQPGKFGPWVQKSLTPQDQQSLVGYFKLAGIPEPYLP